MAGHSIGIMQPYFFPYIGYFQHIHACDVFVFLDDVAYANLEYVRRNHLLINGKRQAFMLEMENRRQSTEICDLRLSSNDKWRRRILKTIEFNYKKTPHFEQVMEGIVRPVMETDTHSVAELNKLSVTLSCTYLGVNTKIINSSRLYDTLGQSGADRIRSICQLEHASMYINPIGGRDLYFHDEFRQEGLQLKFLQPNMTAMEYAQGNAAWTPYLSIIDVVMWNDKIALERFLESYDLVDGYANREARDRSNRD